MKPVSAASFARWHARLPLPTGLRNIHDASDLTNVEIPALSRRCFCRFAHRFRKACWGTPRRARATQWYLAITLQRLDAHSQHGRPRRCLAKPGHTHSSPAARLPWQELTATVSCSVGRSVSAAAMHRGKVQTLADRSRPLACRMTAGSGLLAGCWLVAGSAHCKRAHNRGDGAEKQQQPSGHGDGDMQTSIAP